MTITLSIVSDVVRVRFWSKVDKSTALDVCWPWLKGKDKQGYGKFGWRYQKQAHHTRAHRMAWILSNGDVPTDQDVLHRCDNPSCCNPAHLFLGTQKDNMHDMMAKGRARQRETHPSAKLTWQQVREARMLRAQGWTFTQLAQHYGVRDTTMANAVIGNTWQEEGYNSAVYTAIVKPSPRSHAGENCGMAKLTWEQVQEIRHLYAKGGWSHRSLAKHYNVAHSAIGAILRNSSWKEGA